MIIIFVSLVISSTWFSTSYFEYSPLKELKCVQQIEKISYAEFKNEFKRIINNENFFFIKV